MSGQVKTIRGRSGKMYSYVDDGEPKSGAIKDVYYAPDNTYVVAFFKKKQDANSKDRILRIVTTYQESIFSATGGAYWKELFRWPSDIVEEGDKTGVIVPFYDSCFFFSKGFNEGAINFSSIKGKEKNGKWYASSQYRNKNYPLHLHKDELGDWSKYISICLKISRAVRRMHSAGLAHSDLSYANVLIDPVSGRATIIDLDGLVVPGRFPPDVIGTPDFIAPEVLATIHLPELDPGKKLPSILTDRHALAVMIYMYLLYRHPLRGKKRHDADPNIDEQLAMGSKALFIEHPTDFSNRADIANTNPRYLPWCDTNKIPYTVCGPYLSKLFDRAFITGLHTPSLRPTAQEWEDEIIKTIDLLMPCENTACDQKWFIFNNTNNPACPFCGTKYKKTLPILDLYYAPRPNKFRRENHRIMIYSGQTLYEWQVNRNIFPNERTSTDQRIPVGDFHYHQGKWIFINRRLNTMRDITENKVVPIGTAISLDNNKQILFSSEHGGRLAHITIANR